MPKKTYTVRFRQDFMERWTTFAGTFVEHCERFGVSRQTGYDWLERVAASGLDGLETRSFAPHTRPYATPDHVVELVLAARRLHPTWGPRKLGPWLEDRHRGVEFPAASTMGEILMRAGLVARRRRRSRTPRFTEPFSEVAAPNDTWTADFKGQFRTRDGAYCYPLTIADAHSRFLLRCDAYLSPDAAVRASFESAFREFGLPRALRTDTGTPFASPRAPAGISALSVWWIRLGIKPERTTPASPWQNGRHERMHRTLKAEATAPAQANRSSQQRRFDAFRYEYNHDRPHEALGQKPPVTAYNTSSRPYPKKLPELVYPDGFVLRRVTGWGRIRWANRNVWVSHSLAGEVVGLQQVSEGTWKLFFGPILLGTVDERRLDLGLIRVSD